MRLGRRIWQVAATRTVTGAHGSLTDADIAGVDSITANARADTVVVGLRDALGNAAEHDPGRNVIQRWFNRD